MKKALLLALALCGFSALQAVTITWSNINDNVTIGQVRDADSYATLVLTAQDGISEGTTVALNSITLLRRTDEKHIPEYLAFDYENSSNRGTLSNAVDKTNSITINGTSYTTLTYIFAKPVNLTIGNEYTITGVASNYNRYISNGIGFGSLVDDAANSGVLTYQGGNENTFFPLYTIEATYTPPTTPDVPEPTALALLALGVAGLALKRKVA